MAPRCSSSSLYGVAMSFFIDNRKVEEPISFLVPSPKSSLDAIYIVSSCRYILAGTCLFITQVENLLTDVLP